MTWPTGALTFDVQGLLEEARRLDKLALAGPPSPATRERARAVVDGLEAYVDSLNPDYRAEIARRLVSVLAQRPRFTPTVAPRRPVKEPV